MLTVEGLHSGYGALEVLRGVSFAIESGRITTILGPNGAGKSTTLMALTGNLPTWKGSVTLGGEPLNGLAPRARARRGLVLVPEGRRVFATLSVEENLRLGAWAVGRSRADAARSLDDVYQRFPRLLERRRQAAGTLSGGEQQMLAIGRGLMAGPKVLLVDECSLGLSPVMVAEVLKILTGLAESGMTVVAVEQNTSVLRYASQAIVLEQGEVKRRAAGAELASLSEVLRDSYLGEGGH